MNPLSLLKALPLKDYLYLGAIITILIGFGVYTSHERSVGAAKTVAQDTKLAGVVKARNEAISALAANGITKIGDIYVKTVAAPITDSPHVFMCKRIAPAAGSGLSAAAGHPSVPAEAADVPAAAPVDIGPPIDHAGRDADALIVALQGTVRTLVAAMQKAAAP